MSGSSGTALQAKRWCAQGIIDTDNATVGHDAIAWIRDAFVVSNCILATILFLSEGFHAAIKTIAKGGFTTTKLARLSIGPDLLNKIDISEPVLLEF
jgi:hypothetical protein